MILKDRLGSRRMAMVRLAPLIAVAVVLSGCDLLQEALQGEGVLASPGQLEPSPNGSGPDGWMTVSLTDPALDIEIPASWQQMSASEEEDQLKAELPSLSGDLAKAFTYEIQLVEQGQARYFFQGPSSDTNATDSIEIDVLTNDDSLAAAVLREDRVDSALIGPPATRVESSVTLPIGPSILETATSKPSSFGVPSMSVGYFIRLNGSTIELLGSALAEDTAFPGLMAHIAASLSQN